MKKFRVTAVGTEYLQEEIIQAENWQKAKEQYEKWWESGLIPAGEYELSVEVEEVKQDG